MRIPRGRRRWSIVLVSGGNKMRRCVIVVYGFDQQLMVGVVVVASVRGTWCGSQMWLSYNGKL